MKRHDNRHSALSLAIGAWLAATATLQAAVTITSAVVNDRTLPTPALGAGNYAPLRLDAKTSYLRFDFTESGAQGRPTARLRYKLEGYDTGWCDLPNTMSGYLQFLDRNLNSLDTVNFPIKGETPGWRGSLEASEYEACRKDAIVPSRAAFVDLVFLSHGPESTIGLLGIDDVRISLTNATASQPTVFDLNVKGVGTPDDPQSLATNWERRGSRIALAEIRNRPHPTPHAILALNDTDPETYAIWATVRTRSIPVTPGDALTLEWKTAHSIGGSGKGRAEYLNLKPGSYFLRIAACRANGDPTGEEAVLPLTILPPFYHRWEFWLAMLIASSAGSTLIVRLILHRRMRQRLAELERERAMDRERERIARDLHDNIGAGLTEIAMQTDWIDGDLEHGPTEQTRQRVKSIRQSATDLARGVDEMVWAVNPTNDTLKRFVTYLTQCAAQFLEAAGVAVRFDIPGELPDLPLSGKIRHNLFLVTREALNNTAKHSRASIVRLEIRVEDPGLRLAIEDDGQGFDPAQAGTAGINDGLENMRRRMEDIGGCFALASQAGKGTRIELWAPLAKT